MNELTVVGVRVELPSNQPIVLLREVDGDRYLPIWIGAVEATAIAFAQQGIVPARPMTHDLLKDVLEAVDARLQAVQITELRDGIFYADLVFDGGVRVSARPSDAIALAIRAEAPIFAADRVIEESAIEFEGEEIDQDRLDEEVAKFRNFLDEVTPDQFAEEVEETDEPEDEEEEEAD